ncbi:MAG TPA: thioredoxin domain-containing protein, partial [Polyangiaceae bacterium]
MLARRVLPLLTLVASFGCHASSGKSSSDTTTERTTQPIARTPEQIRLAGNHLLGAASAYLQQHAHNPVDWYPWGAEALALAVKLDRPIFLSIGYVSCHWCHVMEKEVFEQDDVAAFLNEHFISIKVDREERPDLDAVYMAAVQAMTGSGGWPMTTFLTPSLRPFFGGTYLPHDRFLQAIRAGAEQFSSERNQVENHGADVYARIAASEPSTARATLALADLHAIARESLANVDASAGGFRGRTKFPTPIKWRFLLDAYRKWGDADLAQAVKRTLDAMATGGLRDQVAGGFFRYGTEPSWTIPHFEKMLYDNAQLGALYLEAAAAFSEPRYRAIGLDTLDFILSDMQPSARGFGASFDADAAGKEGSTYLWTRAELSSVLGATDGQAVADLLAITEPGNFEGSNVPTLRGSDSARPDNLKLWLRCRPKLVAARRRRPQPAFDSKRVTAWNGLAIGALALGYRASGELRFREAAERAADVIWRLNRSPTGELARTSNGERAGSSAVLDDYAFFADGLLELFQATSQAAYLEQAISLTTQANERFAKPAGGWFLTSGSGEEPLGRRSEIDDGVEPSGNAVMIRVLEELAALTGRNDFTTLAERALEQYASTIQQRNIDMAGWLDDALLAAGPY